MGAAWKKRKMKNRRKKWSWLFYLTPHCSLRFQFNISMHICIRRYSLVCVTLWCMLFFFSFSIVNGTNIRQLTSDDLLFCTITFFFFRRLLCTETLIKHMENVLLLPDIPIFSTEKKPKKFRLQINFCSATNNKWNFTFLGVFT